MTTSACPSPAAHISAVWPRVASRAFTSRLDASSTFTASALPVRDDRHQRGLATRRCSIRIRAGLQQPFDDRCVPGGSGERERRRAVAIGGLDVCARLHEKIDHRDILVIRRPVKGRRAVDGFHGGGLSLAQQGANGRRVSGFRGFDERRLARRSHEGSCTDSSSSSP